MLQVIPDLYKIKFITRKTYAGLDNFLQLHKNLALWKNLNWPIWPLESKGDHYSHLKHGLKGSVELKLLVLYELLLPCCQTIMLLFGIST